MASMWEDAGKDAQELMAHIMEGADLLLPKLLVGIIVVLLGIVMLQLQEETTPPMVNLSIRKEEAKVVDSYTIKDIEELMAKEGKDKCVMCRCWKSEKFPFCDGSHAKHNKECSDNTGPLIISKN